MPRRRTEFADHPGWTALLRNAGAMRLRHGRVGSLAKAVNPAYADPNYVARVAASLANGASSTMPSARAALDQFARAACDLSLEAKYVRTSWVVSSAWRSSAQSLRRWFRILNRSEGLRVDRFIVVPDEFVSKRGWIEGFVSDLSAVLVPRRGFRVRYAIASDIPEDSRRDVSVFELRNGDSVAQDSTCPPSGPTGFCTSAEMVRVIARMLDHIERKATDSLEASVEV